VRGPDGHSRGVPGVASPDRGGPPGGIRGVARAAQRVCSLHLNMQRNSGEALRRRGRCLAGVQRNSSRSAKSLQTCSFAPERERCRSREESPAGR
jgi:hypothetical protein